MRGLIALGLALAAFAAPAAPPSPQTPDFSGSWERYPQPGETADPRYARIEVPDPPLKQPWLAQWQENQATLAARIAESQPPGDNYIKCLPDGMPAMMQGMFPMEVFQRPEQINITQEAFNQTRRIVMNEPLPRWDEVDPTFFGRSVGRWDGDTLVIETTGIKEYVQFRWTPHSEAMKITERLTLLAPDILSNHVTVEDEYLERPWVYSYTYRRMPGYRLLEYVCEDNRDYVDEDGNVTLRLGDE
jgi:hypothetical protein